MRKLFLILLLANAVLFAAMHNGWLRWGVQTAPAQPALNKEMIRLPNEPESVQVLAAASPVAVSATNPRLEAPLQAAVKSKELACLEWGGFSGSDLARAGAALDALQLGDRLSRYQVEHDTGYWVYFPPLKNREAINKKIGELKARGIDEYFVVQEAGRWRNAISLGVFKTQEAAQSFLEVMKAKRVRTAEVGKRASKFKVTVFRLNGVGTLTEVKMSTLQKEFSGSELKHVPCELTR